VCRSQPYSTTLTPIAPSHQQDELIGAPYQEVFAVHQLNYKKVAHLILNRY
jgi:hypothetical protein